MESLPTDPEVDGASWTVGVAIDDGALSVFRVNTDLRELGASSPYGTAVLVTMAFTDTDERGLPTTEASAGLEELGERVVAHLRTEGIGVLTAHVTTPNVGRTFVLYLESMDGLGEWFGPLVRPYGGRAVKARSAEDPTWSVYAKQLSLARGGAADALLIDQLRQTDVDLDPSRCRSTIFDFRGVKRQNGRSGRLPSDRFSISDPRQSNGTWIVTVQIDESVDIASLAHWRAQFTRLCADFGGIYDGWGVPVDGGR